MFMYLRILSIIFLFTYSLNNNAKIVNKINLLPIYAFDERLIQKSTGDLGEENVIKNVIKNSDTVIDAGANIGNWSKMVFKHHVNIKGYGFEPVPDLYKQCKNNLSKYPIEVYQYAVSDSCEEVEFCYYPTGHSLSSFYDRKVLVGHHIPIKISVPTITIDEFVNIQKIDHIDFLKIDTEGAEWLVLCGAKNTLKSKKISYIQFEYGGCFIDAKTTLKQIIQLLDEHDFRIFKIREHGIVHLAQWKDNFEDFIWCNYLAISPDHAANYAKISWG